MISLIIVQVWWTVTEIVRGPQNSVPLFLRSGMACIHVNLSNGIAFLFILLILFLYTFILPWTLRLFL